MKDINWAEGIGFALILIGFALMILNDTWVNNPIPSIMERHMLFSSGGLLIWAIGNLQRQANAKKPKGN